MARHLIDEIAARRGEPVDRVTPEDLDPRIRERALRGALPV